MQINKKCPLDDCKITMTNICLYGTPANSAESQLLEAWPASQYGQLRESADLLRMRRESADKYFLHLTFLFPQFI